MHNFRRLVVAEERRVLRSEQISSLIYAYPLVRRSNEVDVPRSVLPDSVLVVSVLRSDHVRPAWTAVLPKRVVLVSQVMLKLLVRRELCRMQNLLVSQTAKSVVLE